MAKVPAKPAPRTPARPPARTTPSKAQQAARHQGRPEPNQRSAAPRGTEPQRPLRDPMPAEPRRNDPAPQRQRPPQDDRRDVAVAGQHPMPAHMRQDAGLGAENISREDLDTPRLKLIQGISPELQEFDDLRAGNFLHTASEFIFNEPFEAVPVFMDKRYILWRPRDSGGGILARADDFVHWAPSHGKFTVQLDKVQGGDTVTWELAPTVEDSGLANWGTMNPNDPNSPPAATLMYSYVLAFPDMPDLIPAVLTFQRSSIKQGRRFNNKIKMLTSKPQEFPIFGCKFLFSSFVDRNGQGKEFMNINVRSAGLVEDPDLYDEYRNMHFTFRDAGLQIKDLESAQDDIVDEGSGDEGDEGNDEAAEAQQDQRGRVASGRRY